MFELTERRVYYIDTDMQKKERKVIKIKWHPLFKEKPPRHGSYLVTIADYENYVGIRKYSIWNRWCKYSIWNRWKNHDIIAWAELPEPFDSRKKSNFKKDWHSYPRRKTRYIWSISLNRSHQEEKICFNIVVAPDYR